MLNTKYQKSKLVHNLNKEEADYWESFYIGYFGTLNPENGYNCNPGGVYDGPEYASCTLQVMRKVRNIQSKKGRKAPWTKVKINGTVYPNVTLAHRTTGLKHSEIRKMIQDGTAEAL